MATASRQRNRREAILLHFTPEIKEALSRIADGNGRSRKRDMERLIERYAKRLSQDAGQGAARDSAVGAR